MEQSEDWDGGGVSITRLGVTPQHQAQGPLWKQHPRQGFSASSKYLEPTKLEGKGRCTFMKMTLHLYKSSQSY